MLTIALAVLAFFIGLFYSRLSLVPRTDQRLPPGPKPLPVIGNLHMLSSLPHRALHALAQKHGPVMQIHLGRVRTVVISSPEAAEQVLRAQDRVFASRPSTEGSKYLTYGSRGMVFTAYGPEFRTLRKLCTLQLLTPARVESFAGLRRREVASMVEGLRKAAERREAVDLRERVGDVLEELTFRMMVGSLEVDTVHFRELVKEGTRLMGAFNLADFVPVLGVFDLQGLTRKMKKHSKAINEMLDKVLAECRQKSRGGSQEEPSSFVEVLMSIVEDPDGHSIQPINVKAIMVEMAVAALDTAITLIEWTLSELLRNPAAMARVHQELNNVVGLYRAVDEADLPRLAYLDMAIMESFRLHPVGSFLLPRESTEDAEIDGFFVPKKTWVLVNSWAIGRDPSVWPGDTEEFVPERFEGFEAGFHGNNFRFFPFGAGRRGCPGKQLGLANVRLVVAQLVHCFTWELPDGKLPTELDMAEKFALSTSRAEHLLAVPTYRLITRSG